MSNEKRPSDSYLQTAQKVREDIAKKAATDREAARAPAPAPTRTEKPADKKKK